MKNLNQFSILFCMTILFMLTACDQGNDQNNPVLIANDSDPISNRGDCDECPGANECCCVIEWLSGSQTGEFSICGTSDGDATTCTTQSLCDNDVDGLEHTLFELSNTNQTEEFCMDEDMAFRIQRIDAGGLGTVYARVSCTIDGLSPQWKLVSFTADGRAFYDVDEDCLLTACD